MQITLDSRSLWRKIPLTMKFTFIFILLGICGSYATNSYAQDEKMSVKAQNATIEEVISMIEEQSNYVFFYNTEDLSSSQNHNIELAGEDIYEILDNLVSNTSLTYRVDENYIFLDKKEVTAQQQQMVAVTGTVTDQDDFPLPGVTITVLGSSRGVITDNDGRYNIDVNPSATLQFSFIGMETQNIPRDGRRVIDVVLIESSQMLEEVQIVGFGQQKKGSVTSAVASVDGTELRAPVGKLSNTFAGQIAGVISVQRSGEPGYDQAEFWIRGISSFAGGTSPLVLVDGVPRGLNDIEADEIESFTVLKDAAATAVYGAQGANGVVLITSKRGRAQRAKISYRGEVSYLTPTREPRYANSYDFLSLYNEGLINDGRESEVFSDELLELYRTGADPDLYPSTNWWQTLINDQTYNTRHTLNFRGGTERARYFVSGAYYSESGYFKTNPEYDNNARVSRYSLRSNIDIDVTENTLMRVDFSGQYLSQNRPRNGTQDIFNRISRIPPYLIPPVYSDGTFAQHPSFTGNRQNPWVYLTEHGYMKTYRSFIQSSVHLEQKLDFITPGLKARGLISYDSDNNYFNSRTKNPATYFAEGRDDEGNLIYRKIEDEVKFGNPASSNNSAKKIYLEAAVDYARDFGSHSVTGLLLGNRQHRQLHDEALAYRKESFVGRGTYTYDNRYTVEFNFGFTGSEQFAKGHRYGFFPAVGVAWNVSNEPYFPSSLLDVVSNFRLRASVGRTGNDATGGARFLYMPTFGGSGSYAWGITSGGTQNSMSGLIENRFESPGLSWEIEDKRNIGVDLGLWNNRVDISVDFFNDERSNILLQRRTVLNVAGFRQNPWQNYGIVSNKGLDGSINLSHIIGDFRLSGKGTLTYAKNKILEYDELPQLYPWMERTGKRLVNHGSQLPLIAERLFTEDDFNITTDGNGKKLYELKNGLVGTPWDTHTYPGDIKYMDLNGDGLLDDKDRVYDPDGFHPQVPEAVYGFGFGLDWKGLYFNAFFQGVANVTVNMNSSTSVFQPFYWGLIESNVRQEFVEDRWTPENQNPDAFYPRMRITNTGNNWTSSTYWYRNGNFLRFKNLEIGYNFQKDLLNKVGLSASRVYLSGHNLHVWDHVKMFDPEIGNTGGGGTRYPLSRTWTMGIEVTF